MLLMYHVLTQIMIHGIGKLDCQNLSNKISLRCRSSFAITTIIYVALKCVDAGGELSKTISSSSMRTSCLSVTRTGQWASNENTRSCREDRWAAPWKLFSNGIAMSTLFTPVARNEIVQSMSEVFIFLRWMRKWSLPITLKLPKFCWHHGGRHSGALEVGNTNTTK